MIFTVPAEIQRILDELWARRFGYGAFVALVTLVTLGITLVLPVWFRAETSLLPPPEGGGEAFGTLASLIQSSALGQLGLVTTSSPSDVFAEILKSRTLHEQAIRKFGFEKIYRQKGLDRTLIFFRTHLSVDVTGTGIINLSFEDRDPVRAANVANYLTEELDRFNREAYNTRGKRTRIFLEYRLNDVQTRLAEAESVLGAYEKQHKVIASADVNALQGAAAALAERMNLEIRRSYIASISQPDNPALREIDAQLRAMDQQIAKIPGIKLEGTRLALDVEVQRKVFALLTTQLEDARIQETRDIPTVSVLDRARAPELKARPKRVLIVAVAALAAMLLAVIAAANRRREPAPAPA